MKLLLLNGPNLNLLGAREPEQYGSNSLALLQENLTAEFPLIELSFYQSNHEGDLIDQLQAASGNGVSGIVFNPGGYTHSSVAIRDAIAAIEIPVVEVHITNIASRESFRHVSVTSGPTAGQISGFGLDGYAIAVRFFADRGGGTGDSGKDNNGGGGTGSDSGKGGGDSGKGNNGGGGTGSGDSGKGNNGGGGTGGGDSDKSDEGGGSIRKESRT